MKTIKLLVIAIFCTITLWSQSQNKIPLIGAEAPSFKANTTNGKINFPEDFGDSWKILFSHPKDFTPVCTSEILQLALMQKDFDALDVKFAVLSTDDLSQHQLWKQSIEKVIKDNYEATTIKFPFIEDPKAVISRKYGMIHDMISTTEDVRGVFIIGPENKIRSINFYPMEIGRNLHEIKRTVIALQITDEYKVLTPVNWDYGDDVLVPYRPDIADYFENNAELSRQYFYNIGNFMWYKVNTDNELMNFIRKK